MELLENMAAISFIAFSIERTLKVVYEAVENKKVNIKMVVAILVGIVVAFVANIDFYKSLNLPYDLGIAGIVLTGIALGGGSNVFSDLVGYSENKRKVKEFEVEDFKEYFTD